METSRKRSSADRLVPASADARATKASRRQPIIWKVVSGSVLALIAVTLVILWPVFNAAGPAPGTAMALTLVVLSLIPLLLLRSVFRRAPRSRAAENAQPTEGSEPLKTEGKDRRYLLQRAAEELKAARESKDPAAAAIHRDLAKLYVDDAEATADEDKK